MTFITSCEIKRWVNLCIQFFHLFIIVSRVIFVAMQLPQLISIYTALLYIRFCANRGIFRTSTEFGAWESKKIYFFEQTTFKVVAEASANNLFKRKSLPLDFALVSRSNYRSAIFVSNIDLKHQYWNWNKIHRFNSSWKEIRLFGKY